MESPSSIKLGLALLLISCPATALLAATAPKDYKSMAVNYSAENRGFMGWSAGGSVGLNTSTANINSTSTMQADESPLLSGPLGTAANNVNRVMVNKFGPMGNLFAGYGYMKDIYYVGANLGVNFIGAYALQANSTSSTNAVIADTGTIAFVNYTNTMTTQTEVTRSWAQGFLDLKLGGLITPETLAYGLIGTSYSSATIKSTTTYSAAGFSTAGGATSATANNSFGYQTTKYFFGLRLGAGMEVLITDHIGVGAQYVYTFYPSFKTNTAVRGTSVACDSVGGCVTVPATLTNYTRTTLNDQQAMAVFTYHLGV